MDANKTEEPEVQIGREVLAGSVDNLIDFDKFHSALGAVNLLNCQGSVVRVSGLTIESSGPKLRRESVPHGRPRHEWAGGPH